MPRSGAEVRSHDPARGGGARRADGRRGSPTPPTSRSAPATSTSTWARVFPGYKHAGSQLSVVAAENALRACGYEPRRILTGGASDANILESAGLPVTNLANGTERNHRSDERVSVVALEGMLDVVLALVEELG